MITGGASLDQLRRYPGPLTDFLERVATALSGGRLAQLPRPRVFRDQGPDAIDVHAVIAFGSAITDAEIYRRCAEPGIKLAVEPDSEIIAMASAGLNNPDGTFRDHKLTGSIFRNYNVILDQVAGRDDLEALVLLHQDSEIIDPDFCERRGGPS